MTSGYDRPGSGGPDDEMWGQDDEDLQRGDLGDDLDEIDDHDEPGSPSADGYSRRAAPDRSARSGSLPTVYLHVGTFKAGTSYLQGRLNDSIEALKSEGVLFPGRNGYASQVAAVKDVLGWEVTGTGRAQTDWAHLVDEVLNWPGRAAVVSMEFLSAAPRRKVVRVVKSFEPAEVNVIVTARDLLRVIPSTWQETTQNRQTRSWSEFIEGITSERPNARDAHFWATHDVNEVVSRWVDTVGSDHLYVVTVPPRGAAPDVLWQRFSSVLGIDPDRYPADDEAVRANASLDIASAELLRRVNASLPEDFPKPMYGALVKKLLAKQVLVSRATGAKPELPDRYRSWAIRRSNRIVRGLRESGVRIVGDLAELVPEERPVADAPQPDEVSEAEVAQAAVDAVVGLLEELASRRGQRNPRPPARGQRRGIRQDGTV